MKIYLFIFFFLLVLFTDLPKFGEPLQNITVPVGREALLSCVVDNLQTYKVIESHFSNAFIRTFYAIRGFWSAKTNKHTKGRICLT